jgi:undecaprenyl-diphosphatase
MTSAGLTGVVPYARRAVGFVSRHRWSVPLSLTSSVLLLYLGAEVRRGQLVGADAFLAGVVHGWRGSIDGLMLFCTQLGGGDGMAVVSLAVIAALLIRRRLRTALFMSIAAFGTLALNVVLKLAFHRARPADIEYMIQLPSSFSFPSGHAMGSMGVLASTVVVLYAVGTPPLLRRSAMLLFGSFVFGVALSRVYFGVHYPSDVIGGQLAAAAWVSALTGWFYPWLVPGERTLHPAPSP